MWWFWKEPFELFSGRSLLGFTFTVGVEFVVKLVVCIQDVCAFTLFFVNSVILSPIKRIRDTACLEWSYNKLCGNLLPRFLDPLQNEFFAWCLFFPDGVYVNGPVTIQAWYCVLTLVLKGLFRYFLRGWRTEVRPQGITAMLTLLHASSSFMPSYPRKESHTSKALWSGVKRRFLRTHSFVPIKEKKD